jgi:hypothetical protein
MRKILEQAPPLKAILLSADTLESKEFNAIHVTPLLQPAFKQACLRP